MGAMAWLCLLYGGLLYVAVGVLGGRELATRIGGESARIVHMVEVAEDIGEDERQHLHSEESKLTEMEANYALAAAGQSVQALADGIGVGVGEVQNWLDETQPVPSLQQRLIAACPSASCLPVRLRMMFPRLTCRVEGG